MKLASLKSGRDGRLVVVSDDLAYYADAGHIVATLQGALDDWDRHEPALRNLATDLEHGTIPRERFHEREAAAPLPRAYQWADGSAYVNHVALVRQARGAEMPDTFWHDPLMYQGGSDGFLGARDDIPLADEAWGCDLEAEVVVVTGDVPQGVSAADALKHIRLIGLTNDVSLRNLIPGELAKGFGFFHSKPAALGGVGDQGAEVEGHVLARVGAAKGLAVEFDFERAVKLALRPASAKRVGRDEHWRETRCGFGMEEAEALGQFAGNEVAQADVVGQPDQPDVL